MIKNSENVKYLIHNTSKIILKKKKTQIEDYKDLRTLAIMPAMIMVFDKLIAKVIDKEIKRDLSPNQHGARESRNTLTTKLQLIYTMNSKEYNKILLIDLKKAFDLVVHEILLKAIDEAIKDQNDKCILKNVHKIY